ncbi:unnamed protein product, partial [Meganyctiphanes norvegica]
MPFAGSYVCRLGVSIIFVANENRMPMMQLLYAGSKDFGKGEASAWKNMAAGNCSEQHLDNCSAGQTECCSSSDCSRDCLIILLAINLGRLHAAACCCFQDVVCSSIKPRLCRKAAQVFTLGIVYVIHRLSHCVAKYNHIQMPQKCGNHQDLYWTHCCNEYKFHDKGLNRNHSSCLHAKRLAHVCWMPMTIPPAQQSIRGIEYRPECPKGPDGIRVIYSSTCEMCPDCPKCHSFSVKKCGCVKKFRCKE